MAVTREQVVAYLSALSPADLQELILELEDIWGVERPAIGPRYVAMGAPLYDDVELNVVLLEPGPHRVAVIKAVRELVPSLSLSEARDLVDSAPVAVREGMRDDEAYAVLERLRAAGAAAEVR